MNILFLCGGYRSTYSGNFIPSLLQLEKMVAGKCVYAFHPCNNKYEWCMRLKEEGHIIEFVDFEGSLYKRIDRILALIDKYSISVVHIHFGEKVSATLCGYLRPKVEIIWHIHSDWSCGKKRNLNIAGLKALLKEVGVKCIGMRAQKLCVSPLLAANWNGIYIPNGISEERTYDVTPTQRNDIRESLGICFGDFALLCFAWSPYVKGLDIVVRSIKKLNDRGINRLKLMIITGPDDSSTRKWISENTECTGNEDYLLYCKPTEDVFQYHHAADAFLSASRSEGFAYTLCEALFVGKACIVSDISGVGWSKEYKSVEFFQSEDVDSCTQAIMNVQQKRTDEQFHRKCEADRALVRSKYNAKVWAESVAMVYFGRFKSERSKRKLR